MDFPEELADPDLIEALVQHSDDDQVIGLRIDACLSHGDPSSWSNFLRSGGLEERETLNHVARSGACQFSAVADQLFRCRPSTESFRPDVYLRLLALHCVSRNQTSFQDFMLQAAPVTRQQRQRGGGSVDMEEYARRMGSSRCDGDHITLQALCDALKVKINVVKWTRDDRWHPRTSASSGTDAKGTASSSCSSPLAAGVSPPTVDTRAERHGSRRSHRSVFVADTLRPRDVSDLDARANDLQVQGRTLWLSLHGEAHFRSLRLREPATDEELATAFGRTRTATGRSPASPAASAFSITSVVSASSASSASDVGVHPSSSSSSPSPSSTLEKQSERRSTSRPGLSSARPRSHPARVGDGDAEDRAASSERQASARTATATGVASQQAGVRQSERRGRLAPSRKIPCSVCGGDGVGSGSGSCICSRGPVGNGRSSGGHGTTPASPFSSALDNVHKRSTTELAASNDADLSIPQHQAAPSTNGGDGNGGGGGMALRDRNTDALPSFATASLGSSVQGGAVAATTAGGGAGAVCNGISMRGVEVEGSQSETSPMFTGNAGKHEVSTPNGGDAGVGVDNDNGSDNGSDTGGEEAEDCSICMCTVTGKEDAASLDKCVHAFHFACIIKWGETTNQCPMCKARFNVVTRLRDDHVKRFRGGRRRQPNDDGGVLDSLGAALVEDEPEPEGSRAICLHCGDGGAEDQLMLCDGAGCNNGAHTFCCGLEEVPSGDWFCPPCQARREAEARQREADERRDAILRRAWAGDSGSDNDEEKQREAEDDDDANTSSIGGDVRRRQSSDGVAVAADGGAGSSAGSGEAREGRRVRRAAAVAAAAALRTATFDDATSGSSGSAAPLHQTQDRGGRDGRRTRSSQGNEPVEVVEVDSCPSSPGSGEDFRPLSETDISTAVTGGEEHGESQPRNRAAAGSSSSSSNTSRRLRNGSGIRDPPISCGFDPFPPSGSTGGTDTVRPALGGGRRSHFGGTPDGSHRSGGSSSRSRSIRSRSGSSGSGRSAQPNFWPRVLASATSTLSPRHTFTDERSQDWLTRSDSEDEGPPAGTAGVVAQCWADAKLAQELALGTKEKINKKGRVSSGSTNASGRAKTHRKKQPMLVTGASAAFGRRLSSSTLASASSTAGTAAGTAGATRAARSAGPSTAAGGAGAGAGDAGSIPMPQATVRRVFKRPRMIRSSLSPPPPPPPPSPSPMLTVPPVRGSGQKHSSAAAGVYGGRKGEEAGDDKGGAPSSTQLPVASNVRMGHTEVQALVQRLRRVATKERERRAQRAVAGGDGGDGEPRVSLEAKMSIEELRRAVLHGDATTRDVLVSSKLPMALRLWLEPMRDGGPFLPLPQRASLLKVLKALPVQKSHLRESGIGKLMVTMAADPRETPDNRELIKQIVQRWSQLVFRTPREVPASPFSADNHASPSATQQPVRSGLTASVRSHSARSLGREIILPTSAATATAAMAVRSCHDGKKPAVPMKGPASGGSSGRAILHGGRSRSSALLGGKGVAAVRRASRGGGGDVKRTIPLLPQYSGDGRGATMQQARDISRGKGVGGAVATDDIGAVAGAGAAAVNSSLSSPRRRDAPSRENFCSRYASPSGSAPSSSSYPPPSHSATAHHHHRSGGGGGSGDGRSRPGEDRLSSPRQQSYLRTLLAPAAVDSLPPQHGRQHDRLSPSPFRAPVSAGNNVVAGGGGGGGGGGGKRPREGSPARARGSSDGGRGKRRDRHTNGASKGAGEINLVGNDRPSDADDGGRGSFDHPAMNGRALGAPPRGFHWPAAPSTSTSSQRRGN